MLVDPGVSPRSRRSGPVCWRSVTPSWGRRTGRRSSAAGERRYEPYEKRLAARPHIAVPTVTLDAEHDPFTAPGGGSSYRDRFTGPYDHRFLEGVGHNLPQEAPEAFARAVVDAQGP